MTRRYTHTEQMVLSGMRLATEVTLEQHARDWPNEPTPVGVLLSADRIVTATNIGRPRRVSEYRIRQALHALTRDGIVTCDRHAGMGGATTTWRLAR